MKKRLPLIGLALGLILIAIQFFPPARNLGRRDGPDEIAARYAVPAEVHTLLVDACYDCHSDRTNYPKYANLQPIGWWMEHHVNEGKSHLDFSRFGAYGPRQAARKLDAIANEVDEGDMPLRSYTWMHPPARLTEAQRAKIVDWAQALHDKLDVP
jgi:hypothetical protein